MVEFVTLLAFSAVLGLSHSKHLPFWCFVVFLSLLACLVSVFLVSAIQPLFLRPSEPICWSGRVPQRLPILAILHWLSCNLSAIQHVSAHLTHSARSISIQCIQWIAKSLNLLPLSLYAYCLLALVDII
jgi:hypothetical protein